MSEDKETDTGFGSTIVDITDRATKMLRDEIELAKAEVSAKLSKLIKGLVVALSAGVFVVIGLLFLLHGAAWAFNDFLFKDHVAFGYFATAGALFLLGGLAGFIAAKAVKAGAPPTPDRAIEQARKVKDEVSAAVKNQEASDGS